MSALTTALELSDPAQNNAYDITVYQMGWRLGGKGASGRNQKNADRIEEHGLHIWCGFYENAFRAIRAVYEELGRAPEAPLSTWDKAFKAQNVIVYPQEIDKEWTMWELDFPTNPMTPGDHTLYPFTILGAIELGVKWMYEFLKGWPEYPAASFPVEKPFEIFEKPGWWEQTHADAALDIPENPSPLHLIKLSHHLFQQKGGIQPHHHPILVEALRLFAGGVWDLIKGTVLTNLDQRRHWMILYLGAVGMAGALSDDLITDGFQKIDGLDFREWLNANTLLKDPLANNLAIDGSVLPTALYNIAFAYDGGDSKNPNFSAAVAISLGMRIVLGYKGSVLWKMQAGMGDTIFAPIYTVLKRRGVKVKFFHQIANLHPQDGVIASIEVERQVDLTVGEYDPLILVKGLPCWPSDPLYNQIDPAQAARLQTEHIDLERYNTGWQNVEKITLTAGVDYDLVVLGIPVAALKYVCSEIIAANYAWQQMTSGIHTVQTQATQLWFKPDLKGLGWVLPSALLGTYVQPFSTVGDYSQLIPVENWPIDDLHNITYVCDVLPDLPDETQVNADARVHQNAVTFLEDYAKPMWPKASGTNAKFPEGLDWSQLVAPDALKGTSRFDAQYWRANIDPSSRYTLCVKGSGKFRLKTDQTGYPNLRITGTWIDNGFHMGCIEGAVMSGMMTSQSISGLPKTISNI